MTERIEVQRTISAPAADIFAVLCDPQGHVAIDASGMLQDADGAPAAAVGDSFVVHMDREALNDFPLGKYDVTVSISEFEQDRLIAWTILGQIKPQIGHVYGYRLEPDGDSTPRHVVLRLVRHRPALARRRYLPRHFRGRAARDAGDPRSHGAPRLSARLTRSSKRQRKVDDPYSVNLKLTHDRACRRSPTPSASTTSSPPSRRCTTSRSTN